MCTHRELREKIQPEILELIKQQRLNRLCEGSSFRKIGNRRRQGEGQMEHQESAWDACRGTRLRMTPFAQHCLLHLLSIFVFQRGSGTAAWR